MKTELNKLLKSQKTGFAEGLNTCIFAEIIKIDLKFMRLDVKVDMTTEDKSQMDDNHIIFNVPIATHQTKEFVIRPPYAVGEKVLIIASQQDIEPILFDGGNHLRRQYSLDDALLIGGITKFTEPLPSDFDDHEEDFVIAKRDYSARIIFKKNGALEINTDEDINIESKKDINIESKQDINISAPNGFVTTTDSRSGS